MGSVEARAIRVRGGEILVRAAVPADAAEAVAHRQRMVNSSRFIISEIDEVPNVDKQRKQIEDHLADPGQLLLAAEIGGEEHKQFTADAARSTGTIVGMLSFRAGSRRRIAHQGGFGIGVDPEWRGRGVGSALIAVLLDWAAAHPVIEKVGLGVFATNKGARRLYERMGFLEEARQVRFVKEGPGVYVDDVMMCIFVKPGVAPDGFRTWRSGEGQLQIASAE